MRWAGFADYLIGLGLSPKTVTAYVRWVRGVEGWLSQRGTSLAEATATDIAAYADARIPNSHASRGHAATAFRYYWEHIGRERPPVRAIRVPPQPEMVCRAIDEAAARDVVKVALGWWPEGTVVLVGMYLALRRFEIAKMEWSRFDDSLELYTVTGKRDKTATLPVHLMLRSELAGRQGRSRWVFPGRFDGRHVTPATIWNWTQMIGRAAGMDHLTPHELRHTALTTANDKLGDLRAVQTFARHSKPSTTAGYTRTKQQRLREVSDSLDYL
jgi:integrase/recombinase XerC